MTFSKVKNLIKKGIPEVFPSASLLVGKGDDLLFKCTEGFSKLTPEKLQINVSSLYDIASLTKVISTTTLIMLAVQENKLSLETAVKKLINDFPDSGVKIIHLLAHTSGLPDWKPYYLTLQKKRSFKNHKEASKDIVKLICREKLLSKPDEKRLYSDLGFILLGFIIEGIYNQSLHSLFKEKIAKPLKLNKCSYPAKKGDFAATEDCKWRSRLICGEVHDENAFALGGFAGHAGLFSDTGDIFKFSRAVINCYNGKSNFIKPEIIREFFDFKSESSAENYAIGWDKPSGTNSSAGRLFSDKTIGHLGFTGCSMWLDLERSVTVILLTNRVHPSRINEKIKEFRPLIHDAINKAIG